MPDNGQRCADDLAADVHRALQWSRGRPTRARNNDLTTPVAVGSIWQSARDAGLSVAGYSELRWWQELFPAAWDRYQFDEDPTTNLFALAELADLTLIHPVYVDHAGHEAGAGSAMYADAGRRLDSELGAFLDSIDLDRDLVVVTADHGHTLRGGHGGSGGDVASVLTCFAGHGVQQSSERKDVFDARSLAPTLAVLLGVPFPSHMRASDDNLDQIEWIVDASLGSEYLEHRTRAVERFRAENRRQIAQWLGSDDLSKGWSALYQRERSAQTRRALGAVLLLLLGFVVVARVARIGWRRSAAIGLWCLAVFGLSAAVYSLVRGGFDFTSINSRVLFLRAALGSCAAVTTVGLVVHFALTRKLAETARDLCLLTSLSWAAAWLHLRVYGDPLGFPLPGGAAMFFPFFISAMTVAAGLATMLTVTTLLVASRASRVKDTLSA